MKKSIAILILLSLFVFTLVGCGPSKEEQITSLKLTITNYDERIAELESSIRDMDNTLIHAHEAILRMYPPEDYAAEIAALESKIVAVERYLYEAEEELSRLEEEKASVERQLAEIEG